MRRETGPTRRSFNSASDIGLEILIVASEAELLWWDKFADVMAKQWNLTPAMNRAIRDGIRA